MPREGTPLHRSSRPFVLAGILAVAFITPASASATVSVGAPSVNFGSVPVGTASTPQAVGLTSSCTSPVGATCPLFVADAYYVHISATGDFSASSDCGNPIGPALNTLLESCTM